MKFKTFRSATSTFWRWFFFTTISNLVIVVLLLFFVFVKPLANSVAQVIGIAAVLAASVDKHGTESAQIDLKLAAANFSDITFSTSQESLNSVPNRLILLAFIQRSLYQITDGEIQIGYVSTPKQELLVRSNKNPHITMHIANRISYHGLLYMMCILTLVAFTSIRSALWISKKLTKPLEDLARQSTLLGKNEEFSKILLPDGASKEIVQLADTINKMNAHLYQLVEEREFVLSSVAHDLRTPLSRMRLAIELDGSDNAYTEGLREDVSEMGAIMDQFIEASRLSTEVNEALSWGDLNKLVTNIQGKYQRAGIDLSLMLSNDLPTIRYKPTALSRLLYNLIDNAHHYGCGNVIVVTERTESQILLSVSNPIGLKNNELSLMSAINSSRSSGKSAGLGLLIVKRFAQVHNATLQEITSNGNRKYVLSFPL